MKKTIITENFVYCISIERDFDPCNPRTEWDNMGTICIPHNRYSLSDKNTPTDFELLECELGINTNKDTCEYNGIIPNSFKGVIVPIHLYIHSGISIRSGAMSNADGYAYITKADILKEYGGKILTKKLKERATAMLECEIKTFNQYLQGNVWGYSIERLSKNAFPTWVDLDDEQIEDLGEHVSSCWGYYYDSEDEMFKDMEKELRAIIENDVKANDKYEIAKITKALYDAQIATLQLSLPIDEKAKMQNIDIIETLYPCVLD